jgi:hypothetical protein
VAPRAGKPRRQAGPRGYGASVFINCPFDAEYGALLDAMVFAVHDCGFIARCALELRDGSEIRLHRIMKLIRSCRFGIHDISRTELDRETGLPRFNMPLELGLFLGAKSFGGKTHSSKVCLVLDTEKARYQMFCSDIAGQDPSAHGGDPARAIGVVRDWLRPYSPARIPGAQRVVERYVAFRAELPAMLAHAGLDKEIIFADYSGLVTEWLEAHPQA